MSKKNKKPSPYKIEYWKNKGFNEKESLKLIENYKDKTIYTRKNYWVLKGFTEEEAIQKIKDIQSGNSKKVKNRRNGCTIQEYTNKGFTEEEAQIKLKERQTTFTLEKCIQKYGEEEGRKKWQIRQDKWQNTLNNKTQEEKDDINKRKGRTKDQLIEKFGIEKALEISNKKGKNNKLRFLRFSKISKKIFSEIQELTNKKLYYAEEEKRIKIPSINTGFWVDLLVENTNKIIEFNGNFYHANPNIYTENSIIKVSNEHQYLAKDIWKKDKKRLEIWEDEWVNNKEECIVKSLNFIENE